MALEPITRAEQIIAGKDLQPITRMEKFLKEYGGGSGSVHPDSGKTIFYYSESSGMVHKDNGFAVFLTADEVLEAFLSTGITLYLECDGYADVFALSLDVDVGKHGMHFYHPVKNAVVVANNSIVS